MSRKTKKQITLLRERLQKLKKSVSELRQQGKIIQELDDLQAQITRAEGELALMMEFFVQK